MPLGNKFLSTWIENDPNDCLDDSRTGPLSSMSLPAGISNAWLVNNWTGCSGGVIISRSGDSTTDERGILLFVLHLRASVSPFTEARGRLNFDCGKDRFGNP